MRATLLLLTALPSSHALVATLGRRPTLRPALRLRSVVMGDVCSDNICYTLSTAKPEKLAKLTSEQLQAQVNLLEQRIANVKRAQEGLPALDTAALPDVSKDDSISWALASANPAKLEKLSPQAREEQLQLLEKQLGITKDVQNGMPVAPPASAPVEVPSAVESAAAPEPPAVSAVIEPSPVAPTPVAVPEPPPVAVPESAVEAPQVAAKSLEEAMGSGDDAAVRSFFDLPEKIESAAPAMQSAMPAADPAPSVSGPFGLSLPSPPKLPDLGGGMPKMPDSSPVELPGGGGGGLFGFLGGGGGDGASGGGGLALPSAPSMSAPDLGALSLPSPGLPPLDLGLAGGVPWGLFLIAFTLFPVLVILGSKALEMAGVIKPPTPPS